MAVGLKTQIWNNRIKSAILLAGFPVLLLLLVWAFFALVEIFEPGLSHVWLHRVPPTPMDAGFIGLSLYWPYPLIFCAVWYVFASFSYQGLINAATGAHAVSRSESPKIYNMLENLCISRGMVTPRLYIIESDALNAYASGLTPKSYAITVTRGLVDALTDPEMEAVLGHELTHIINKDVSLMMVGVIFAGLLTFLCDAVGRSFRFGRISRSRSSNRDGKGLAVIMLIAFVLFMIGRLFAIALRLALSRRREYLADAGAVELTKNPDAMIAALKKISHKPQLPGATSGISQMCIETAQANAFSLFSTHPPIEDRIKALEMMGGRSMPW